MGTGASAVSEQVKEASPEDLLAVADSLPPELRAKLQDAVAEAQADKAGAAPAEAEGTAAPEDAAAEGGAAAEVTAAPEETAAEVTATTAPETAAAEGTSSPEEAAAPEVAEGEKAAPAEGAAEANPAPYLAEYFDMVQKRSASLVADEERLRQLAMDADAQKRLMEESKAWFEKEAQPLLTKSFKHHDANGNDVLSKDEAAAFFQHMVTEETDFAKTMSALSIDAGVKMSMGMLNDLDQATRDALKAELDKQIKIHTEAAQTEVQKKEDAYKANKADYDEKAFKVLDTNGDGTIQLSEFIAAFEPESKKNQEFHMALGYVTQEELDAQAKSQENAKEKAGDCNQQ